jgi:hypothetical protein
MVIAETAKLEKVVARAKRLQGRFKRKKASSDDNLMELMLGLASRYCRPWCKPGEA